MERKNLVMEKKYCTTHHFYYSERTCPYCLEEQMSKLVKKFGVKEEKKDDKITEEALAALVEKFNGK